MQASQTSSFLTSREMNFWVLSLDNVIVILLSIVNDANNSLRTRNVQVWGCDDSHSFTIFSVTFMIFWVHKQA